MVQHFLLKSIPNLAKAYPTNKLPDLRGEFIRGWDDGRGVDAGRALLNWQPHTILDHAHYMELWTGDGLAAGRCTGRRKSRNTSYIR